MAGGLGAEAGDGELDSLDAPIETQRPVDLRALLDPIRLEYDLPALAGAILRGNQLVAIGASGLRKRGVPRPVSVDDRWHLGSCGKAMTATVIARLVERGVLRWDTTLAEGLPELAGAMHPDYRAATLEQLLSHRAGVPAELRKLPIWGWLWQHQGTVAAERAELVRFLVSRAPETPPGTAFAYSNGGYTLAAAVAEQKTGTSFEELIRVELFEPLGMRSAGFGAPRGKSRLAEPWGHAGAKPVEPGPTADNPPAIAPAGTMHASLADWARFVRLHLAGARGPTGYLAPATFRKLHTPAPGQKYALGWQVLERDWGGNRPVLNHAGSNTRWFVTVWIAPARNFAVLVATNQGGDGSARAADAAAWALIQRFDSL